jgi:hypothetical protein
MMTKTLAFALAGLPLKWAKLVIPDPTTLAHPNYEASILLCSLTLAAFARVHVFRLTDHLKVIREVKRLNSNFTVLRKMSPASTT